MNFLLDVNASGALARLLIHLGHDVVEVGEKDPRMSDDGILSWALSVGRDTVKEYLGRLKSKGVLVREGAPRSGSWVVLWDGRNDD